MTSVTGDQPFLEATTTVAGGISHDRLYVGYNANSANSTVNVFLDAAVVGDDDGRQPRCALSQHHAAHADGDPPQRDDLLRILHVTILRSPRPRRAAFGTWWWSRT